MDDGEEKQKQLKIGNANRTRAEATPVGQP